MLTLEDKQILIKAGGAPVYEWKIPFKRMLLPRVVFTFSLGLSFGFTVATLILSPTTFYNGAASFQSGLVGKSSLIQQETSYIGVNISKTLQETMEVKLDLNSTFVNELLKGSEEVAARRLAQEVRILCLVMTMPRNHQDRAVHIRETWGRHCNVLSFISTKNDSSLPTTNVQIPPRKDMEWAKMEGALNYVHRHRMNDFEWVVKVDHDTFVVVENLRMMLSTHSHNDATYFELSYGVNDTATGANNAGYVLSKEAVHQLVTNGYTKQKECQGINNPQVQFGKCLKAMKIGQEKTRDSLNRRRSLPFDQGDLSDLNNLTGNWWEDDYVYWPMNAGLNCCSEQPISFHLVKATINYMLEYLIYHVRPYSVVRNSRIKLPSESELVARPSTQTPTTTSTTTATTTTVKVTTATQKQTNATTAATTAAHTNSTTAKAAANSPTTAKAADSTTATTLTAAVTNATTVTTQNQTTTAAAATTNTTKK